MSQADVVVIEITGEGRTDVGQPAQEPEAPTHGVIPVLIFALCDRPRTMRVRRRPLMHLQGKGLWQKARFAKQQAFYNGAAGAVFVVDTEGDLATTADQLKKGRDAIFPDFPMAIGSPHPCIEAWLLCDGDAICKALNLGNRPSLPDDPEALPAPRQHQEGNPKSLLNGCSGANLTAAEKSRIAAAIVDLQLLRLGCPLSFEPFAGEVESRIKPVFR